MRVAAVLVLACALLPSCSTPVPATVTFGPSIRMTKEPTIAVLAVAQRPQIEQSLLAAGLIVPPDRPANYWLEVDVGASRGSQSCGPIANVKYTLIRRGTPILVVKARGPTGACDPNVFDEMSRLMESYFGDGG